MECHKSPPHMGTHIHFEIIFEHEIIFISGGGDTSLLLPHHDLTNLSTSQLLILVLI